MRICNTKTKVETGFDYVLNALRILTPYGRKRLKSVVIFEPGKEAELRYELERLEKTVCFLKEKPDDAVLIQEILSSIKDNSQTIERSMGGVLSVVELFEIKTFLMQMERLGEYLESVQQSGIEIPNEFKPKDLSSLLDIFDPGKERIKTFYIYDFFSAKLAALRKEKRQVELGIRKTRKEQKCQIEAAHNIIMTPKFEYLVPKSDKRLIEAATKIEGLILSDEDYMTAVFTLKSDEKIDRLKSKLEEINEFLEEEELIVREMLTSKIGEFKEDLLASCKSIGELDFNMAKGIYAIENNCIKVDVSDEHVIKIQDGRHLMLENALIAKGKSYLPVSIQLKEGVTSITGANMGGKTITLKMVGQCALLAQHGFFVPASHATIGLSGYIHILVGDSQNLKRGLSSFGSEMEELKDILDNSKERALLLIDEIASGTNPTEGQALTRSIVKYLNKKPFISLVTTHFDEVSKYDGIRNLQVRGLSDVDFDILFREIRYANRQERIEIIGKYMDYRLEEVEAGKAAPKDALNIARMLGISSEIIEEARKFMEDRKNE